MESEEAVGPLWSKLKKEGKDKAIDTTLEGYFYWFLANSTSKQKRILKYAIARLAREHPQANPREVILEFFAESIYDYEQHVDSLRRGHVRSTELKRKKSAFRTAEVVLTERINKLRRQSPSQGEANTKPEGTQRVSRPEPTSTGHRSISIFG